MGYSKKNVTAVYEEFEARRQENKAIQQDRLYEVYSRLPEIKDIDKELSRVGLDIFGATMQGKEGLQERLRALQERNEALQTRRAELLISLGYDATYTNLKYDCPLCQDSGYVDAKMCICLKNALTLRATKARELSIF